MAFQASFPFLHLTTHASALAKWESITPVRGRADDNIRPLARRSDTSKTIRKTKDGSIALCYHNTDVVTFRPDDTVTLEPYASVSTNSFVWATLGGQGDQVQALWADRDHPCPDHITRVGDLHYHTPSFATVKYESTGWVLLAGSEPFEVPMLDKAKCREALHESGFNDFALWFKTLIRLGLDPRGGVVRRHYWSLRDRVEFTTNDVSQHLRAGSEGGGWQLLANKMRLYNKVESDLGTLRKACYRWWGAAEIVSVPYLTRTEFQSVMRRMREYG